MNSRIARTAPRGRVLPILTVLLLTLTACQQGDGSAAGASLVAFDGRQLLVRRPRPDGTLPAQGTPFVIRGVVWSPAGRDTRTWAANPDHAGVMRAELWRWQHQDLPLLADLGINTVRLLVDPGVGDDAAAGRRLLDDLHARGIMVIMNVDHGVNDLQRLRAVVRTYRDHPAVLLWMLGVEWNINLYYGVAKSMDEAIRRTEQAAALIKSLDPNHPVASSYGDIHWEQDGHRLADTARTVNTACPSVDVWALNIYRGARFGDLFQQWASITDKPMFLGEYGTDAFRSADAAADPPGQVDEAMQAQWNLSLWRDLSANLAGVTADGVAAGGTLFAWNDEWWKVAPPESQQTSGFPLPGGHPDGFANEEYFGLVDIDRRPRAAYRALRQAFRQ